MMLRSLPFLLAFALLAPAFAEPRVSFEENLGQADHGDFLSRAGRMRIAISATQVTLWVGDGRGARLSFLGACETAAVRGRERLAGQRHYLRGADSRAWQLGVRTYAQVVVHDAYPGVDIVYREDGRGRLEFDLMVKPEAALNDVRFELRSIDGEPASLESGALQLALEAGAVRLDPPMVYQQSAQGVTEVWSSFARLDTEGRFTFEIGPHDSGRPLVIDPVVDYSTFLGGSNSDRGSEVGIDGAGNVYVTGSTDSPNFPTLNPAQAVPGGGTDTFITKIAPDGSTILYSTFIGGSNSDTGNGIDVDLAGNAYVCGHTWSPDLPTINALYPSRTGESDAFAVKLDPMGMPIYVTYLGGGRQDAGMDVAVDASGNATFVGLTEAGGVSFPLAGPAAQSTHGGGQFDAFLAKLNANGSALLYGTYLGGDRNDWAGGVAVDGAGNAWVGGLTESNAFPTVNPVQAMRGGGADAFVARLNPGGTSFTFASFLGGSGTDYVEDVAVDSTGAAIFTGPTDGTIDDFPTVNPFQATRGGQQDAFVTRISPAGALSYSTYLGGFNSDSGRGAAVDGEDNAWITGSTGSANFPTTEVLFPWDGTQAFVSKLTPAGLVDYSVYASPASSSGGGIAANDVGDCYVTGQTDQHLVPLRALQPIYAGDQDAFVIRIRDDRVAITQLVSPQTFVAQGQEMVQVDVTLQNDRANAVAIDMAALEFRTPGGADVSVDYAVTPDPGNPTTISAGGTAVLQFAVDVSGQATLGDIVVDATAQVTDMPLSRVIDIREGAVLAHTWEVVPSACRLRSVIGVPPIVQEGSSGHAVSAFAENIGPNPIDVLGLDLSFFGVADRASDYTVTPSPTNPTSIASGATERFDFTVDVLPGAALEIVTLDARMMAYDAARSVPANAAGAASVDVWRVTANPLRIVSVDAVPATVLPGSTGNTVTLTVESTSAFPLNVIGALLSFSDVASGASLDADYTAVIAMGAPATLAPGVPATFTFGVDVAPGAMAGDVEIDGLVAAFDPLSATVAVASRALATDVWTVGGGSGCGVVTCGDCNADGTVNILDALFASQHAVGSRTLTGIDFSSCNVAGLLEPDPGAQVDIVDALRIAQEAASGPTTVVCCQ